MVRTHWKLAYRAFRKALAVTIQTASAMVRASFYSRKTEFALADQRTFYITLEKSAEQKTGKDTPQTHLKSGKKKWR